MLPRGILSLAVAFLFVVAAAAVCGRFPLLANPGPESGMVLAVVGGLALALAMAKRGGKRDPAGYFADWSVGAAAAGVFVLVFLLSTAIGAAVSPTCSPSGGRLPMLTLAIPPLLLQAAFGVGVGRIVRRPGLAVVVCFVLELAMAASLVFDFLREPSFRSASHFFVVVSGDLLRGATLPFAAIGFRLATCLLCLLVVLVGSAWWPATKKSGLGSSQSTTWPLWIGAVVVGVAFVAAHSSARQALSPTRAEMVEAYSLVKKRGPLVVHADPLASTPREVDGMLAEGTLWFERLRARLGDVSNEEIHIWLHATREAQAHWTGASHVDFALPWRRELHIAGAVLPHRSLGHELAHVIVGEKSTTMLRAPARFGILHNPAVTEGVAMALTPELIVDEGLTLREQAAAMRRGGRAPELSGLFSFSRFFSEEPGRAYVAAGALVEQIIADAGDEGPTALARLYRGAGALEDAVVDVDDLIARHVAALDRLPLPPDAIGYAAARFSRPSILQETCDPGRTSEVNTIRSLARTGNVGSAVDRAAVLEGLERGASDDVADGTLSDLLQDVWASGDDEGAIALLRELVTRAQTPADRVMREYILGGELWRSGHERDAVTLWERLDVSPIGVDRQRQIRAATIFGEAALRLRDDAIVSRAALRLLVGSTPSRDGARLALAEAVGRTTTEPAGVVALGRYILGRQLVTLGNLDDGVRILRPLVDGVALDPVFHQQAILALATALVRKDKPDDARALLLAAADAADRGADRMYFRDRADRATRAMKAPAAPPFATATSDSAWADRLLLGTTPEGAF